MQRMGIDATGYETDKAEHQQYLKNYEEFFEPLKDKEVRLLELGIYKGGSLLLWRDYFSKGMIVGLDVEPVDLRDPTGRIKTYQGMQQDTELLDRLARETAPEGFDVIIDDCSHIGELTRISFWHLFDHHLKSGGLYVIEDWGTGYWQSFFDGARYSGTKIPRFRRPIFRMRSGLARLQANKTFNRVPLASAALRFTKRSINKRQFRSHDFGMVGFIKELVDECGMANITREDYGKPPYRPSRFREVRIFPGQVFIVKA